MITMLERRILEAPELLCFVMNAFVLCSMHEIYAFVLVALALARDEEWRNKKTTSRRRSQHRTRPWHCCGTVRLRMLHLQQLLFSFLFPPPPSVCKYTHTHSRSHSARHRFTFCHSHPTRPSIHPLLHPSNITHLHIQIAHPYPFSINHGWASVAGRHQPLVTTGA